ncbi:MAG: nicotinate mononucleotide-dependent phosphoribosyltransferase CobT [Cyanobacteria bacterium P01_H01_bin.119]
MAFRKADADYSPLIRVYTQRASGLSWLDRYRERLPQVACVLGFTETGLLPGISAAGATPSDRRYTAIADAEFLYYGVRRAHYPLPPLSAGASPAFISRAVIAQQQLPLYLFNAGLPIPPAAPAVDLSGQPAACLSSGRALDKAVVNRLFQQGLHWGQQLASRAEYLILAECVVGGTTTAQALLTGLGIPALGKVNSSHAVCNHKQKQALVAAGLTKAQGAVQGQILADLDPLGWVAAVGDPMQPVVAGMALSASQQTGVMLAGGTQMLAVYALAQAIARRQSIPWRPEQVVVGTTRWVAEDPSGDTVGLAQAVGEVPLIGSQASFIASRFGQLQAYEQGFVKEGVGAGGCMIAANLYQNWNQAVLLSTVEALLDDYGKSRGS